MSATTYRLVDGTNELLLSGTGGASPIVVVSSEFTYPAVRNVQYDRLGVSGKRDLSRLHDSSEFSATLKIQGDSLMTRYDYLDELKTFLGYTKRPYLYLQRDGWLSERRCLLRGDGVAVVVGKTSGQWLEAAVRAVLPEGVIEDNEPTVVTLRSGARNVGAFYPMYYPMSYEADTSENTFSVSITGNDMSLPYIRIYGNCNDPQFILTAPDDSIHFFTTEGLSIAPGSYLDIDFANRRVFLNGTPEDSLYSRVNFAVSEWWALEPGINRMSFLSTAPAIGCYAEISYRNTYLP